MTEKADILYLAWERLEFTKASLRALIDNTNWDRVNRLWIYTDSGSYDAVLKWPDLPLFNENVVNDKFGSPVEIMNDYLEQSTSNLFVKLDNDVIVPPGWLDEGLQLMADNPLVDLLGIEAHLRPPVRPFICTECLHHGPQGDDPNKHSHDLCGKPVIHGIRCTDHIGGIGFMRRRAFAHGLMQPNRKYFGFTEYQWANPQIIKAWIDPPLRVFLLDHLPFDPWASLSAEYIAKGWQRRQWGKYGPAWSGLWEWWHSAGSMDGVSCIGSMIVTKL